MARAPDMKKLRPDDPNQNFDPANINAQNFTFREIATATKNFRKECLLGEEGFGRVYKGVIPATGQVVAVKQLDRNGVQGSKEFLAEVCNLSFIHHENLVKLIGYCADGDQRLLVYEFIHGTTLEDRLFEGKDDEPPLDWFSRMKVAADTARGVEYLHDSANPPILYRDLKTSNIILDENLKATLYDFGIAKLYGGDKMTPSPARVMGTFGHCAPEYVRTGQLTLKSDVYSFGVVLLELITGRRAIDTRRPNEEQNLVSWAQPLFRDPKRYPDMADPLLNKQFPEKDLNQAVAIAAMCLQEEPEARPLMSDVLTALSFLSVAPPAEDIPPSLPPETSTSKHNEGASESESESESERESKSELGKESHGRYSSDKYQEGGASSKYQESDVSDMEGAMGSKEYYAESSRKSSARTRNGTITSESEDDSVFSSNISSRKSPGNLSHKSSRKSSTRGLSQRSSKKASAKGLSQKSSRKSPIKDLNSKSSRKSSVKVLSHKNTSMASSEDGSFSLRNNSNNISMASDHGGELLGLNSSRISQGNISFGLISSGSFNSDNYGSKRIDEDGVIHYRISSGGSDEGSEDPFDIISSNGSEDRSVHYTQ
ncbi:hypothetical protein RIF29_21809 [Crotalaria pallida]|uniref:Protein kinase domain-containing protein n=1 Tax=Crotalaria pallida TaxID=3830 RepID=A0AAN9I695_CROPI